MKLRTSLALALALVLPPAAGAVCTPSGITLTYPASFTVKRCWNASELNLPKPLGGLRFSNDGTVLYVIAAADSTASKIYALPVTRSGGEVTNLGAQTASFADNSPATEAGFDAGIETGPGGTLFLTYLGSDAQQEDVTLLGERPAGVSGAETQFDTGQLSGILDSLAGLTFSPFIMDPGTSFGYMQASTLNGAIFRIALTPTATPGIFTPGANTLFVVVTPGNLGGIQYVPAGSFAGDLFYTTLDDAAVRRLEIDPGTGFPINRVSGMPQEGISNPRDEIFASGFSPGPIGLEFDAGTNDDLFVTTYDLDPGPTNDKIYQIGGFGGTVPTTTTTTGTTSSTTTTTATTTTSTTTTTRPTTTTTASTTTQPSTTTTTTTATTTSTTTTTTTNTTTTTASTTSTTAASTTSSTATTSSTTTTRPSTTSTSSTTTTSGTATTQPSTSTTTTTFITLPTTTLTLPTSTTTTQTTSTSGSTSTSTTAPSSSTTSATASTTTTTTTTAPSSTSTTNQGSTSTTSSTTVSTSSSTQPTTTTASSSSSTSTTNPGSTSTTSSTTVSTSTSTRPTTSTATTSSTTRPTTSITATSTTTRPSTTTTTLRAGCADAITLPSIDCRESALLATVDASTGLGRLQEGLERKLVRAHERIQEAEARVVDGRRRGARTSLKAALKALLRFRARLASRAAKKLVAPDLRASLTAAATAIIDDLRAFLTEGP